MTSTISTASTSSPPMLPRRRPVDTTRLPTSRLPPPASAAAAAGRAVGAGLPPGFRGRFNGAGCPTVIEPGPGSGRPRAGRRTSLPVPTGTVATMSVTAALGANRAPGFLHRLACRIRSRDRRRDRQGARPPAARDRADRLREHRLQGRARGAGLGHDQQICRGLSGQALLRRLPVRRHRRDAGDRARQEAVRRRISPMSSRTPAAR